MRTLCDELRIEIFKFVNTPISLALTNREWYAISRDPHARAEWLLYKYGRAHALFHAVRLGNNFITVEVVQALLAKDATMSRYFIQRLLMHSSAYDEKLIELTNEHNVIQADFERIRAFQKKLRSPWASNLPMTIFTKLITEGYNILNDKELTTKGNDMELFHFLSAGPLVINHAQQNLNEMQDLILNKKFIPFPPRPKPIYEDTIEYIQLMQERAQYEYLPKDGYEKSHHLNVIARAILIHPDLVDLWKKIGYYEICSDVNELVVQGALLMLFPPTPPTNWECPDVNSVVSRLRQLIDLGFNLTDTVIEETFFSFENRLNEIGDLMMNSFQEIRKESISDIAYSCFIQTIRLERNHRKIELFEFLINRIDQSEKALKNILEYYNVGFKFDASSIKRIKIRSLSVHSNFYYWILKKYGPNSEITQKCFEDIIESRIWIDLRLHETPKLRIPRNLTEAAFNSICSIYLEFCNEKVPFKTFYLPYLQLANNEEIIRPLFGISLPIIFGLQLKYKLPFEINYEYNRPEIRLIKNNKRKFIEIMDNQEEWFMLLKMYYGQILDDSDVTEIFKKNFENFLERITDEFNTTEQSADAGSSKRFKQ
ncbi:hypothetical protein C1645_358234 [Glomus cerebriforme]|uniref:Uncharacterized protein n=1 Tax=Glomus cerebriforme TaxID=658196 RepID=A0A397TNS2_9GLOM|nr:hypothetical protein C1645_358234 [Glomus cerebriforme]